MTPPAARNPGRRAVLQRSLAVAAAGLGAAPWHRAFADAVRGTGPYGALGPADANGVRLPAGFTARLLAVSGEPVAGGTFRWHHRPDGGACFALPGGGWAYVSNAELGGGAGGASALRFDAAGTLVDGYPILSGTRFNCAGGPTPWGTWLSCEEHPAGRVWECDPGRAGEGVVRPALGTFAHEAAAVDPATGTVYLTEDDPQGRLYRFVPARRGDLSAGVLQAAAVGAQGRVSWVPAGDREPLRGDGGSTAFARGEGAWFADGVLFFCTTQDHRVWALDVAAERLSVVYDARLAGPQAVLRDPNNLTVHAPSGDLFVCEDGDDLECVLLAATPAGRVVAPFLQLVGHDGSELAGAAFDPAGRRLYLSSQRGRAGRRDSPGMTFEVTGPFRS